MSRGAQFVVVVLLLAVAGMGALLVARGRRSAEPRQAAPDSLVVYAPCGLNSPLTAAAHVFRQANPDIRLSVVLNNTNVLVENIRSGDRPDVFVSPGELEMRQMVDEGFVEGDTVRDFGTLDLVLIAPETTEGLDSLEDLTSRAVDTISLAHPDHNSIGYYAEAALRSLNLWEPLQTKLLLRKAPLEAVTLATTGQVDAGITYLTCPLDTAPEKADKSGVRIVAVIPRETYPPVRCQVGILGESANADLAEKFVDFMRTDEAQQVISENGLLPLEDIRQ
jgi:molybdate transport system substrate-binding protein